MIDFRPVAIFDGGALVLSGALTLLEADDFGCWSATFEAEWFPDAERTYTLHFEGGAVGTARPTGFRNGRGKPHAIQFTGSGLLTEPQLQSA